MTRYFCVHRPEDVMRRHRPLASFATTNNGILEIEAEDEGWMDIENEIFGHEGKK